MEKEVKFLKEWAVRYVKSKDVIAKKITSIKEEDSEFVVSKNEKLQKYFIIPFLENIDELVSKVKDYEHAKTIVCFHTKNNFDFLIKNWGAFVDLGRNFTIYFANPFSKLDKVLSLSPYTHELITDDSSLKQGLKTMSETVEFTTEDEVKKIISS